MTCWTNKSLAVADQLISGEMLELWRQCWRIRRRGAHKAWEEEGGRRREYIEACSRLGEVIGLRPWEVHPIDATSARPPALWVQPTAGYARARKLRRLFVAAEAAARSRSPAPPARSWDGG